MGLNPTQAWIFFNFITTMVAPTRWSVIMGHNLTATCSKRLQKDGTSSTLQVALATVKSTEVKIVKSLLSKSPNSGKDPYMANHQPKWWTHAQYKGSRNGAPRLCCQHPKHYPSHARITYLEKDQWNLAKRQEQQVRYFNQGDRDLRELAEHDIVT